MAVSSLCLRGSDTLPVLSVVGVSHQTCPLEVREQLTFTDDRPPAPRDERASEAVWLSTCNRIELYTVTDEVTTAGTVFADHLDLPDAFPERYRYTLAEGDAARHLFEVASGLNSAVIGETEILGQVRRALGDAQAAGPLLTRLFQDALATGKRVRTETEISCWPVSVSSAAASILRDRGGREHLEHSDILVIGAGEMARGVASCLAGMGAGSLTIANRTAERAHKLARKVEAEALTWPLTPAQLARFDAIVSCTSAPGFLLSHESVESAVRGRPQGKPLHLLDLAVPRDIDPQASAVEGVQLSNLDDARTIVDDSLQMRTQYMEPAGRIIEEQLDAFREWRAVRNVAESIRILKERADVIRQRELERVLPKLASLSTSEREAVEQFSNRLVNKLLHTPTLRLRETASRSEPDPLADLMREVFDLEPNGQSANGHTPAKAADSDPERSR